MLRLRNTIMAEAGLKEKQIPLNIAGDKWYITHAYDGRDRLTFEISPKDENYRYIQEECEISVAKGRFIIKNIDEHGDVSVVDCMVDIDAWKEPFWHEYNGSFASASAAVSNIKPSGWTVIADAGFNVSHTIDDGDGNPIIDVTALDVLDRICEIWGCVPVFMTSGTTNTIRLCNPETVGDSGDFYSDELNLSSIGYVGNTTDFATRLYAYGAKDEETGKYLTIASVNGGKEYVEDKAYCDKVVSYGFTDERFTNPAALYNEAMERLLNMAYPVRSYELAAYEIGPGTELYKTVTLIDRQRNNRTKHMVVEHREYPDRPDLDIITLSVVTPNISDNVYKDAKAWQRRMDELARQNEILKNQMINNEKLEAEMRNKYGISVSTTSSGKRTTNITGDTNITGNTNVNGDFTVNGEPVSGGGGVEFPVGSDSCHLDVKASQNKAGIYAKSGSSDVPIFEATGGTTPRVDMNADVYVNGEKLETGGGGALPAGNSMAQLNADTRNATVGVYDNSPTIPGQLGNDSFPFPIVEARSGALPGTTPNIAKHHVQIGTEKNTVHSGLQNAQKTTYDGNVDVQIYGDPKVRHSVTVRENGANEPEAFCSVDIVDGPASTSETGDIKMTAMEFRAYREYARAGVAGIDNPVLGARYDRHLKGRLCDGVIRFDAHYYGKNNMSDPFVNYQLDIGHDYENKLYNTRTVLHGFTYIDGDLCIPGPNGKYYSIFVDKDGKLATLETNY